MRKLNPKRSFDGSRIDARMWHRTAMRHSEELPNGDLLTSNSLGEAVLHYRHGYRDQDMPTTVNSIPVDGVRRILYDEDGEVCGGEVAFGGKWHPEDDYGKPLDHRIARELAETLLIDREFADEGWLDARDEERVHMLCLDEG